jgi:hypothetical protein
MVMDLLANKFKKRSRSRPLGRRLRFIPGFDSHKGQILKTAISDHAFTETDGGRQESPKHTMLTLHQKQKFFCNNHVQTLDCYFIIDLDLSIKDKFGNDYTLREFIMARTPKDSVTDRLFVSVDKKYNGECHVLTTTTPHFDAAQKSMAELIPQTLATFGPKASRWWTEESLAMHANCTWDESRGLSLGKEFDVVEMANDDPFSMNEAFLSVANTTNFAVATPSPSTTVETVQDILNKRSKKDDDQSLGPFLSRPHDGDTVMTEKQTDDAPTEKEAQVTFDNIPADVHNTETYDNSGASVSTIGTNHTMASAGTGATTTSTRQNLRQERKTSDKLRAENLRLVAEAEQNHEEQATNQSHLLSENLRILAESEAMMAQQARMIALLTAQGIKIPVDSNTVTPANQHHTSSTTPSSSAGVALSDTGSDD